MLNTFSRSLIIWEPAVETQEMNVGRERTAGIESWTVPPPWQLYFNPSLGL